MCIVVVFLLGSLAGYSQCSTVISSLRNASCNDSCNGSVNLVVNGVPPFTFSWAPYGQTVQNPDNLCAGTHTVTVVDGYSCKSTTILTITQPSTPVPVVIEPDLPCYQYCNPAMTLQPLNGAAPYQSSQSIGNSVDSYTVTITDDAGCVVMDTATLNKPAGIASYGATGIHVYPNPVVNVAHIDVSNAPPGGIIYITLFDYIGNMVETRQENAGEEDMLLVNFENLPVGAYLMEVRMGELKTTVKVFRQ